MAISFLQPFLRAVSFHISEDNMRIRADQLRARLRLYPAMLGIQSLLEPLFVALFWGYANHQALLLWLSCMYSLHTVDLWLWWRHRFRLNTVAHCRRWDRTFKILTSLTALSWGSFALFFFPQDLALLALMICVVFGLVAGAVTLDSVYPPSLYIYISGVTVPLLARLVLVDDKTHWLLAGMLLMYVIGALSAGRELSKTFWRSLWQRYENDLLIAQLTEQKAIAETANRDKSRFLASASHDLRQPLQALVLFSEALEETDKEKDTRHLAHQIGKSVAALVNMFDELLDISKFDAGVVHAANQHFRINGILDRLQLEFTPMAMTKGLQLAVYKSDCIAYSDPHLLERILRNLISNAIRYTESGKVEVGCTCIEGMLEFEVKDTGIGIHEETIPHIFEEYYQVGNEHRDRLKGLGLGLAIVRRMEALLGCKVKVISKLAHGSVFSFGIPQGDLAQMEPPPLPQASKHDLSGTTVALVDDNQDIRQMAAVLMQQWGCHVHDGELPHEVLSSMHKAGVRPDILVCDYRLPQGLTAIDAILLLRKIWDTDIPALVLTGDTAAQTLQEIQASGALLLNKPIAPARLRSIMYFALHNDSSSRLGMNS